MINLLRLAVIFLAGYFLYMIYLWWKENYSTEVVCPQCDGEGIWGYMEDVEEDCILCKGRGKIEREV